MTTQYSLRAQAKITEVMREFAEGKLRDAHGNIVRDRNQALAIAISKARARRYKVPPERELIGKRP